MKKFFNLLSVLIFLFCGIIIVGDPFYFTDGAYARAGRGGSYRSSGSSSRSSSSSSSSYRSSSSSSSYRSGSSSSSSSSSSYRSSSSGSSSSGGSSPGYSTPAVDYDDSFSINKYSVLIKVNRDATADITETFDVTMKREYQKIKIEVDELSRYSALYITSVASPQGSAVYSYSNFIFGYKDKKVKGRQTFVLNYRAEGAVLPDGDGARLGWRIINNKMLDVGDIKIIYPAGTQPVSTTAVIIPYNDSLLHDGTNLQCVTNGSAVTIPVGRNLKDAIDIVSFIPAGVIDSGALKKSKMKIIGTAIEPSIKLFSSKIKLNSDRTIDVEDTYEHCQDSKAANLSMNFFGYYAATYIDDRVSPVSRVRIDNTLYMYNIKKDKCRYNNITDSTVCIPSDAKNNSRPSSIKYSLYGNFNKSKPYFFDMILPAATTKNTDRVKFEFQFPSFVKKELVEVRLYLCKNMHGSPRVLRRVDFVSSWDGNKLITDYNHGLYEGQNLTARVFIPDDGFGTPGVFRMAYIYLACNLTFNTALTASAIFGMLLFIAGVPALIYFIRKRKKNSGSVYDSGSLTEPVSSSDEGAVYSIVSEDPVFSIDAFLERAKIISEKIQDAWSGGDMSPVRNFVSQGIYNRFRLQLRLMREQEKVVNMVGGLAINSVSVVSSSVSKAYHTLHVKISASARDVTVPADMPEEKRSRALDDADVITFTEIYSFTRRRGAVTNASKNILHGACPSCGFVPDKFSDTNKCPSCGSIYNSGEFDWVLSEITQIEEWSNASSEPVAGLEELEEKNLSMNRSIIEDRASYLFWSWIASRAAGNTNPLARDAAKEFFDSLSLKAEFFAETAVGSVDLKGVTAADGEAKASVLILWSAAFSPGGVPEHREHLFTLVLPVELKNPYGFADHSCDNCGAPLPESDSQNCVYCGAALQKSNSDWLLSRIEDVTSS